MRKIFVLVLFLIGYWLLVYPVSAESLTVTASVGDTALILQGYTSPSSLVTFKENDVVKGTATSNSSGYFEKQFDAQDPGVHTIVIYATDPDNNLTNSVSLSLVLVQFNTLTIDDIYLPPTISLSDTSYLNNETINISGYSKPSFLIKIEFSGASGKIVYESTNSSGYYLYQIDGDELTLGSYQVTSTLQVDASSTSTASDNLDFTLSAAATPTAGPTSSTTATPAPTATNTPTPTPAPCPYPFANLCFFDTEKKGVIEVEKPAFINYLVDFVKNFGKPLAVLVDLNEDNIVDASDLSVFLYFVRPKQTKILGVSVQEREQASVLGLTANKLDYSSTIVNNGLMPLFNNPSIKLILNLIFMEILVGIPFLLVFLFLLFITKKNGKKQ